MRSHLNYRKEYYKNRNEAMRLTISSYICTDKNISTSSKVSTKVLWSKKQHQYKRANQGKQECAAWGTYLEMHYAVE